VWTIYSMELIWKIFHGIAMENVFLGNSTWAKKIKKVQWKVMA